jgi:hypothetical protein
MKIPLLTIAVISILFVGCKDEEISFDELIPGVWVNTHVNDQPVLTDNAFVCDFRADLTHLYALGIVLDEENKSWIEHPLRTYTLEGKTITVEGKDVSDDDYYMEFSILSMDKDSMKYDVKVLRINGEEFPDPNTYTFVKVTTDLHDAFVGTWYGRSTTTGGSDSYHFWDYSADGSYDYYYKDDEGIWVNKPDNEGKYFLYGNLMASNYSNDLLSGETGRAYECWTIKIDGNIMSWEGLRKNNHTATFEMVRVDSPPF